MWIHNATAVFCGGYNDSFRNLFKPDIVFFFFFYLVRFRFRNNGFEIPTIIMLSLCKIVLSSWQTTDYHFKYLVLQHSGILLTGTGRPAAESNFL